MKSLKQKYVLQSRGSPVLQRRAATGTPSGSSARPRHSSWPVRTATNDADTVQLGSSADIQSGGCPFRSLISVVSPQPAQTPTGRLETTVPLPGPQPWSFDSLSDVGELLFKGLHGAMLTYSEKYGPVCRFANPASLNGATSWVFLNSPENVKHICATNVRNYTRRYLPDVYYFITHGRGLLGSQGEYNARHRRLCQPPFRNKNQLKQFSSVIVHRAEKLLDLWGHQESFTTDLALQTQRLTLDVVGLVAFSYDFQQVQAAARDPRGKAVKPDQREDGLLWGVNTFGAVLAEMFITPVPILKVLEKLGYRRLQDLHTALSVMRSQMLPIIQERREALAQGQTCPDDLLSALLKVVDEGGQPLDNEELWEDVHDIMGAGHETTATTTAATIYSISAHPEVEQAVVAELQAVLGGRSPQFEDVERLQYLGQCVKETMRLYPAIPIFPRQADSTDVLPSGHRVQAGDVVFMSSYSLGRCPKLWDQPEEFRPERFSPEEEARQHPFQFLPFGAGPRMCLGSNFAQMSVTLLAATLLQKLRFKAVHPTSKLIPVSYDISMNYDPTNGLLMEVAQRAQHSAASTAAANGAEGLRSLVPSA